LVPARFAAWCSGDVVTYRAFFLVYLAACTTGEDAPPILDAGTDAAPAPDAGPPIAAQCLEPGSTIGDACSFSTDCQDFCFCNGHEQCRDGTCVAGNDPCDDGTECAAEVCDESARACTYETDDAVCQDADVCNGPERCVPFGGCRPGLRMTCTDTDPCTIGRCDSTDGCSFEVRDLDADGFTDDRCGGEDCFDDPADGGSVYPGAPEVCDNDRDDNCNGTVDYREASCLAANDACDSIERLPGAGVYVRSTRGTSATYPLGCRASGPDAVFGFTLESAQDVEATLAVDAGSGSVAIRRMDPGASGPDSHCGESVLVRNLEPGDYAVIVKTSSPASFTLQLSFLAATPVEPVDVCDATTFAIEASGTFNGFFADVRHDYGLSCRTTATAYKDVAYRLVLTEESDIRLTARTTSTSSVSTYLSLVRDCTSAESSIACVQAAMPEIRRLSMPAGTYYVLLESSSTSATTWSLTAEITPAIMRLDGDACSTAIDIGGATATVPIDALVYDYGTSCGGTTGAARDASFTFSLTDTSDVLLTTEPGGIHYVSLSAVCGDRAAETSCTSGTPRVSRRFLRLTPGDYYVTVSTTLASGDLRASAEILPPTFPPEYDSCSMPAPLADAVAFRGELLAAADDFASCGPSGAPETVHRLTLTERKNVTVVARRTDGTTEPLYLGLRDACDAADVTCTSGAPALLNRTLEIGEHHLVVESAASFVGPYSIVVYLSEP
jgi:hypothetical protein